MSANFTPTMHQYTDLTPFRFWCQKILPLAYDDSLSYYELLCKVVDYLNKTMEDVTLSIEDVENLHSAYVALQGYVNNYFNNLDVQEEINNKLDALVADGTIHTIFTPDVMAILNVAQQASLDAIAAIPTQVSTWLGEHVSPETGYVIDDTLTISGAAADAKVTGDRIGELKSEIIDVVNYAYQDPETVTPSFVQGGINASTGVNINATNMVRTAYLWSYAGYKVTIPDGYKANVFYYGSASAGSYSGKLSNNYMTGVIFVPPRNNYFRLSYVKADGSDITPETVDLPEFVQFTFRLSTSILHDIQENYGNNLLNTSELVDGYITSNGSLNVTTENGVKTSGYIKVLPNKDYVLRVSYSPSTYNPWVCAGLYSMTTNNDFISRLVKETYDYAENGVAYIVFTFTTTSETEFLRVSFRTYGNANYDLMPADIPWYSPREDYLPPVLKDLQNQRQLDIKSTNHRGWYECPENTLIAYKQSAVHGYNFVETDVRLTSDHIPVLIHNLAINATARNDDGTELSSTVYINQITYAQALTYDFGIYKGAEFAGTRIATLNDFIVLCKRLGLHPYIEIKGNTYTPTQLGYMYDVVADNDMENSVTWIGESVTQLQYMTGRNRYARIGVITDTITAEIISAAEGCKTGYNEVFINASYNAVSESTVTLLKAADMPLEVWTVDNTNTVLTLDSYITGIASNKLLAGKLIYENAIT